MANINELIDVLGDGLRNAQKASQLEGELKMDIGHTQEPTRDLIRSAIVEHDIPIGSTRNGYFLIDDEAELSQVIGGLQRRIDGLQNRKDGLSNGWQRRQESRENGGNWPKNS